jgi:hypothetical protein
MRSTRRVFGGLDREAEFLDAAVASATFSLRTPRSEILPDREADIAVAKILRDFGEPRIWSQVSLPTGSTMPIQFNSGCFWAWTRYGPSIGLRRTAIARLARAPVAPSLSSTAIRNFRRPCCRARI